MMILLCTLSMSRVQRTSDKQTNKQTLNNVHATSRQTALDVVDNGNRHFNLFFHNNYSCQITLTRTAFEVKAKFLSVTDKENFFPHIWDHMRIKGNIP